MQTVRVSRTIAAPEPAVRDAMLDLEPFTRATGFDEVTVDGRTVDVTQQVGIATIELQLAVVDDPDSVLTVEQREGIFEEMRTTYDASKRPDGVEVTVETDFTLDVAIVGQVLDATIIKRQRRKELNAQLDHLESVAGE